MNKTSRILVALLVAFGCFGFQYLAVAQTDEQGREQADDQAIEQIDEQGEEHADDPIQYMLSNLPPQVTLTSTLHPIIIDEVEFEGLRSVLESDVLKAFREQNVGIGRKYLYSAANFEMAEKVLKRLLDVCGYLDATVEVRIVDLSERSKVVTFIVSEGISFLVKEIRFEGNRVFTGDELRFQLKLGSQAGQEALDRPLFEYDLNKVRNFMRSRGYLQAKTLKPRYESANGGVMIVVPVLEGQLYRIGEINVVGAKLLSPEQIVEIIGLKKGDIADGKRISDAIFGELKNFYLNMGHVQYSSEPEPEYRDSPDIENEGIIDFHIGIDEGACYGIGSIKFQGNTKLSENELRRFLLFREGDIYNQQAIHDSFRNLNESELFEPIDRVADLDYTLDEESHLVSFIIKLRDLQD